MGHGLQPGPSTGAPGPTWPSWGCSCAASRAGGSSPPADGPRGAWGLPGSRPTSGARRHGVLLRGDPSAQPGCSQQPRSDTTHFNKFVPAEKIRFFHYFTFFFLSPSFFFFLSNLQLL